MTPLDSGFRTCPGEVLRSRIDRCLLRRKQPKPLERLRRPAELPRQGSRQIHAGQSRVPVALPHLPRPLDLPGDLLPQALRQHRAPGPCHPCPAAPSAFRAPHPRPGPSAAPTPKAAVPHHTAAAPPIHSARVTSPDLSPWPASLSPPAPSARQTADASPASRAPPAPSSPSSCSFTSKTGSSTPQHVLEEKRHRVERLLLGRISAVLVLDHRGQKPRGGLHLHHLALLTRKHRIARRPCAVTLLGPLAPSPAAPPPNAPPPSHAPPNSGDPPPPPRKPPANSNTTGWHPPTAQAATSPVPGPPASRPTSKRPWPPPARPPTHGAAGNSRTTPKPAEIPSVPGPSGPGIPPDPSSSTSVACDSSSHSWRQNRHQWPPRQQKKCSIEYLFRLPPIPGLRILS